MNCPVIGCEFSFTGAGGDSDPYLAFEVLKHIIKEHKLVEEV